MSNLFWLTGEQIERSRPFFPESHGKPRVDDRRVLAGIIPINRIGLRWSDAPKASGPHKTLHNRLRRWSEMGVFDRILEGPAAKREAWTPDRPHEGRDEHEAACRHRW